MEQIRISVRSLVEFLLRSGDIDNRRGGMADKEAMQLGSRLHRKIQSRMGAGYRPEVSLKYEKTQKDYLLLVEGRADGIQETEDGTVIDEIKGVYRNVSTMEGPCEIHLAQAKCYAAIYGREKGLERIAVQMTYCNLETEEIRRFLMEYQVEELWNWFDDLTEEYGKWCEMELAWKALRQESIKECVFPFAYRDGQKELAAAVYRTLARRKKIFIQAPTGVGKTISAVFPAVKAVGEGLGDKIFYLTAKTITRTVAEEAFGRLKQQGLKFKVFTLTAKEKICPMEEVDCNPDACPYAKGHYDRVNGAVFEMLTQSECYDREAVLKWSEKWKVCPFEMGLDVSLWTDAIICDYNYVFDPRVRLKRFFGEGVKGDYLFLIDEAHNLVERGREMYSASLWKEDFLEMKRLLTERNKKLTRILNRCNKIMLGWKRECETCTTRDNIGELILPLMSLVGEMEDFLEELPVGELRTKILDFYFQVRSFLDISELVDDHYVIYTELAENGHFQVKLYCVDTSRNLQKCLDRGNAAVFFSATLIPVKYYISLLSDTPDDYAIYAKSPFDPGKRRILVGTDVSSRYTRRGQQEYRKIAAYIKKVTETQRGNYLVFFPSYRMMADVAACTEPILDPSIRCIYQTAGMREAEREAFLAEFEENVRDEKEKEPKQGLVGFCVMGGIFGEGIDLKRDRLIGAILVGTGLPQVCREREILKKYYDDRNQDGFAYAYRYPGMNKVLQSAGRVIRTDEDRGIILLLDERFAGKEYLQMFPREWAGYDFCTLASVRDKTAEFWEQSRQREEEPGVGDLPCKTVLQEEPSNDTIAGKKHNDTQHGGMYE